MFSREIKLTWSGCLEINCLFCFSLWANVRKMEFTCDWDSADFAETSNRGKKLESANLWDLCLATSWFIKSFFVPTRMRGMSWLSKWFSASDSHEGRERKLDSLNESHEFYAMRFKMSRYTNLCLGNIFEITLPRKYN